MTNTISFIHCADIHFDTAFSGLSPVKASIRRDELRQTFLRILQLCEETHADFLLLSGDLFDSTRVTDETIAFIKNAFSRFPQLPILIAPGNHDPYMPGTRYDSTSWPTNVIIFKESKITDYTFLTQNNIPVTVYGAAFTTPYLEKNLLENFMVSANTQSAFHVMVLHGDVVSAGQSSVYHPITMRSISQSQLDYLALGHKHSASQPQQQGRTYFSYSGTPEGRGFDELGEKGVWHVTLTKEDTEETNLHSTWIPCASRIYDTVSIDITDCASHQEVLERIESASMCSDNLYKILLTGTLKNGFLLDLNLLYARLSDRYFFVKLRDTTRTELDMEALAKENMLRGIFARRLLAKIELAKKQGNTKEEQLYTDALTLGLKAFEGEVSVYDHQINQN